MFLTGIIGVIELKESHTADYISQEILKCLCDWDIPKHKIMAVVSDNGANITKAIKKSFGTNKYVPCFAHTINLVVEQSIAKTVSLSDLLSNVREIVKFFKRSTSLSDELRKQQLNKGILIYNTKLMF